MSDLELVLKATAKLAWIWLLWPMALFGVIGALWNLSRLIQDRRRR